MSQRSQGLFLCPPSSQVRRDLDLRLGVIASSMGTSPTDQEPGMTRQIATALTALVIAASAFGNDVAQPPKTSHDHLSQTTTSQEI